MSDQEATGSQIILDSYLKTILERVKLLYLLEREGGWDTNQNWEDILSLGEQQRLGMVSYMLISMVTMVSHESNTSIYRMFLFVLFFLMSITS